MAPSLEQAERRRHWMLGTMIFENLFFSAALFGWTSILPVLIKEGLYSDLCSVEEDSNSTSLDIINSTDIPFTTETEDVIGLYPTCSSQAERLNLALTVGLFLLSGLTFPIGMLMDKIGSRYLRIVGAVMFQASCILFGFTPVEQSWLLFPAVALSGVGGIMHIFTSFQTANLFRGKRSTVISLNIGAYASAGVLFLLLKIFYDMGFSRPQIFIAVAVAETFTIVNCIINVPKEPIPDPEDSKYEMHWNIIKTQHKVTGKKFYTMVTHVGRKLSVTDEEATKAKDEMLRKGSKIYSSQINLEIHMKPKEKKQSLVKSIFTPIYLLSLFVLSVAQLRLNIFVGSFNQMLSGLTEDESVVDKYTNIFGYMQMIGILACPIIGGVMDYKIKDVIQKTKIHRKNSIYRRNSMSSFTSQHQPNGEANGKVRHASTSSTDSDCDGSKPPMSLRIRKLWNSSYAFGINCIIMSIFGLWILIPVLELQIVTMFLYCIIRGFINAAACGLYAIMYPANQVGSLIGLQSLTAATASLLQQPIFVLIERKLNNQTFWVDIILLFVSLFCFTLPVFMIIQAKKMRKQQLIEEEENMPSRPSKVPLLDSVPENV